VDNRRLFLAAALSMAVLLLWQFVFPAPEPPAPTVAAPVAVNELATAAAATPNSPAGGAAAPAATAEATAAPPAAPIEAAQEERFFLENERLRAEFSNRGAVLVSLVLRGQAGAAGGELEMVAPRGDSPLPFALFDAALVPLPENGALFAVEPEEEPAGRALRFRYRGPLGAAEKRFLLRADGRLDLEVATPGRNAAGLMIGPGLRARTVEDLANRFDRRLGAWLAAGEVETEDPAKAKDPLRLTGASLGWIALEDTYYLTALMPSAPVEGAVFEPVLLAPGPVAGTFDARPVPSGGEVARADKDLTREFRAILFARGERLEATTFWGAKHYDALAELPYGLEKTVRWGTLGFLARPLLLSLHWIHDNLVSNYGWAIVLLTVALKLVLLPLSISSFKSMRKMQKLSPKMQAIRERWRPKLRDKQGKFNSDAQRQMNEEVMGLYRQEGVNPAGGCLPILVQLPIFLAFYNMLSTAVELKWAPWALWIKDLAEQDPYFVLPIVMGATQLIQQRMTPPPPDPFQKRMMQFLPVVFTVFSLGFPSGLVLYWLTNNVLTIGQQVVYNRIRDQSEEAAEAATPTRPKGRKGS
jgi:YidC/Oxa1 family membrane protein insertase